MGTLSGGGTEQVTIGERCLLGANAGIGISLGDDCVVEAGLYVTAGTLVKLPDGEVVKGKELSGINGMMFIRHSQTGAVEARAADRLVGRPQRGPPRQLTLMGYGRRAMAKAGPRRQPVDIDAAGRTVAISSPGKVMFPERGETKLDLANYYVAVGDALMRTVRDRPTLLQRLPNGVDRAELLPEADPRQRARLAGDDDRRDASTARVTGDRDGRPRPRAVGGQPGLPRLPPVAVPGARPRRHRRAAHRPRPVARFTTSRWSARRPPRCAAFLDELGIRRYPKTTGNRGLHVYVRVEPGWDSYGIAPGRDQRGPGDGAAPARAASPAQWWKEQRGARIFIDFNQNAPHKTVFGAWCVRARVGAQVSTPFRWDELPAIHPDELTLATVPARVAADGDPWATIDDEPQSIEPLVARYRDDLASGIPDAPWPPVYPKMPDEARRVNPSRARPDPD